MASAVHVILVGGDDRQARSAIARIEHLEQRWSRFSAHSDITRLNRSPGVAVAVDPSTVVLVEAMIDGWIRSDGRYDPTLLAELMDAGYTTSVEDATSLAPRPRARRSAPCSLVDIAIDAERSTITVPRGLSLDPGGIGKGLAADLVVAELLAGGVAGALTSIGGDLRAEGRAPTADGWFVRVEDPLHAELDLVTLVIDGGGVCTSSTRSRRWVRGGSEQHHVIDPITRQVSTTDLAAVTVVADTAALAEVHATRALLLGGDAAIDDLDAKGLAGLATTTAGLTSTSTAMGNAAPANSMKGAAT